MSDVMTLTDIGQLVLICAIVFIPLGAWLVPQLTRLVKWVRWRMSAARKFHDVGSLEDYLK